MFLNFLTENCLRLRVSNEIANDLNDLVKHNILLARSTVYLTFFFGLSCIHTENDTNKEQNSKIWYSEK